MSEKRLTGCKYLSKSDIADSSRFIEGVWNTPIKDEELFAMVDDDFLPLRPLRKDKRLSPFNRASYWYQGPDMLYEEILAFNNFGHCWSRDADLSGVPIVAKLVDGRILKQPWILNKPAWLQAMQCSSSNTENATKQKSSSALNAQIRSEPAAETYQTCSYKPEASIKNSPPRITILASISGNIRKRQTTPPWTEAEKQAMCEVMAGMVSVTPKGQWKEPLWDEVSARLEAMGVHRLPGGCRAQWCRGLRERTGLDERKSGCSPNLTTGLNDLERRKERRAQIKARRNMDGQADERIVRGQEPYQAS